MLKLLNLGQVVHGNGTLRIDYRKFKEVEPVESPERES